MRRAPLLLIIGALSACPPPPPPVEDAGTDAGVQVSPVEMCDRISTVRCELLARCYPAFTREAPANCKVNEQERCLAQYDAVRASFDNGKVQVDPAALSSCEERMRTSSCPATFPPSYPNVAVHPFSDCDVQTGLLRGNVPSGETCARGVECAPGTVCFQVGGTCNGVCSAYAKLDEGCAFGCGAGLYCDRKGTQDPADDRCARAKGVNKACDTSEECSAELWCNSGSCRPRGKVGEACAFDPDRLSTCDPGLACDVMPFVAKQVGTCIVPVGAGKPCRFHWSCAPGLVCWDLDYAGAGFPTGAPPAGVCAPPAPASVNCSFTPYQTYVGDQCTAGTACDKTAAKCTALPTLGQACVLASQACSGVAVYCKPSGSGDLGTCTGPAGLNEKCAFEIDANTKLSIPCAAGFCETQNTLTCRTANKKLGDLCKVDGECETNRCAVQQDRSLRCAKACD